MFLARWLFSVAGESDGDDVNSVTIQPFASYGLGNTWSLGTSFMAFNCNVEQSKWASLPRMINARQIPLRVWSIAIQLERL